MREKKRSYKKSAGEGAVALDIKRNHAGSKTQTNLDVEIAVDLMLSAHKIDDDTMRQKYRLDIIKALPAEAIDWNTVDWVQACPFQTTRS